ACTQEFEPVCSVGGATYSNRCMLRIAACRDPTIRFAHEGTCPPRDER
ncbi:unnamed protein product, partial [Discosporangium mesarthrocarpum]